MVLDKGAKKVEVAPVAGVGIALVEAPPTVLLPAAAFFCWRHTVVRDKDTEQQGLPICAELEVVVVKMAAAVEVEQAHLRWPWELEVSVLVGGFSLHSSWRCFGTTSATI